MDEHEITSRTAYYFLKSAIVNLLIALCTLNLLVLGNIIELLLPADDIVHSPAVYTINRQPRVHRGSINGQSTYKSSQTNVERDHA